MSVYSRPNMICFKGNDFGLTIMDNECICEPQVIAIKKPSGKFFDGLYRYICGQEKVGMKEIEVFKVIFYD